jgi:hypothetical protein
MKRSLTEFLRCQFDYFIPLTWNGKELNQIPSISSISGNREMVLYSQTNSDSYCTSPLIPKTLEISDIPTGNSLSSSHIDSHTNSHYFYVYS